MRQRSRRCAKGPGGYLKALIPAGVKGGMAAFIFILELLSNFMRITAGAFAASIVTTFWDRHAAFHQSRLAEASSIYDVPLQRTLDALRGLGLTDLQAIGAMARTLASQAYLKSALDYFWISGWLCVAMIGLVWLTRRPRRAAVAAAD